MDNYKYFNEENYLWYHYLEAKGAYNAFECFYLQNEKEIMSAGLGALFRKELKRLENEADNAEEARKEVFKSVYGRK